MKSYFVFDATSIIMSQMKTTFTFGSDMRLCIDPGDVVKISVNCKEVIKLTRLANIKKYNSKNKNTQTKQKQKNISMMFN